MIGAPSASEPPSTTVFGPGDGGWQNMNKPVYTLEGDDVAGAQLWIAERIERSAVKAEPTDPVAQTEPVAVPEPSAPPREADPPAPPSPEPIALHCCIAPPRGGSDLRQRAAAARTPAMEDAARRKASKGAVRVPGVRPAGCVIV